jgi:hypothetical protein
MGTIRITIALLCTLSSVHVATAAPLTLNFAGHWQHYHSFPSAPGFWNEMAIAGIVNGTPVTFGFTIDDGLAGSNASVGRYVVTGWQLQLGGHTFTNTSRPMTLSAGGFWGASSGAALGAYTPGIMQFGLGTSGLPVLGGLQALATAQWPMTTLYFEFNGPFSRSGGTMNLVRTVPEPATFSLVAAGMLGALWFARRRRNAASPGREDQDFPA